MSLSKSIKNGSFLNNKIFLSLWGILFFSLLIIFSMMYKVHFQIEDIEQLLSYSPPVQTDNTNIPESPQKSQTVYVPVYSHIYSSGGRPNLLEVTLSIRNIDMNNSVLVSDVIYYDTQGRQVKKYLEKVIEIAPLATIEFLVEKQDIKGGSGANFIVKWMSEKSVNEPLIEAVMVGGDENENLSFIRQGVAIQTL